MDINSLLFLMLGKDNNWIVPCMICLFLYKEWTNISGWLRSLKNPFHKSSEFVLLTQYTISKLDGSRAGRISQNLYALMYSLNEHFKSHNRTLGSMMYICLPYDNDIGPNYYTLFKNMMIPSSKNIVVNPQKNIYITFQIDKKDISSQGAHGHIMMEQVDIEIRISSIHFKEIEDYLESVCNEYVKYKLQIKPQYPEIAKPLYDKDGSYYSSSRYTLYPSKTLENMFFDGKDELQSRLDMFIDRKKYKSLGLPETLGLLFYGEPGCGKTSAIKAVANYLKMYPIIVPMNIIKTRKQLETLFAATTMTDIPLNKRMYIFEEIDCNGWDNIVKSRDIVETSTKLEHKEVESEMKKKKETDDPLTLGALLEIIDGIVEVPGRVIIMTTNRRDYLDKALLRPGRIDMEIEFKRLRRVHIAEIYKRWYGQTLSENDLKGIPDYKYTQAQISQYLFKYDKSPQKFVKHLSKIENKT